MNSDLYKIIAVLFSDSMNIQILCSIYENEVTADSIANLLNLNEDELTIRLETLCTESFISRRLRGNDIVYSLVNPKVCDSILMLSDSIEYINQYRS